MRLLRLFGPPSIDGGPLVFSSHRATELLAYLAHRGPRPVSRADAAGALWPSHEPERARHNLRQTLVVLREGLAAAGAEDVLTVDRQCLGLDPGRIDTDLWRFRSGSCEPEGAFAEGIEAEWLDLVREGYAGRSRDALVRRAAALVASDPSGALALARRASEGDPLREDAVGVQAEALAALGEVGEAARVAHAYAARLRGELGIAPGARLAPFLAPVDEPLPTTDMARFLSPAARLRLEVELAPVHAAHLRSGTGRTALRRALREAADASSDERSRALAWISRFSHDLGDPAAEAEADEAARLATTPYARALASVSRLRAVIATGGIEELRSRGEQAERRARTVADPALRAEAHLLIANFASRAYDAEAEARHADRALRFARESANPHLLARALYSKGSRRFRKGDLRSARAAFQEAVDAAAAGGLPILRAGQEGPLGRAYEALGELDRAHELFALSVTTLEAGESRTSIVMALTYLGDIELKMADPAAAVAAHLRALAYRRTAADHYGLATTLRGLGKAYAALGRTAQASEALTRALGLYVSLDLPIEATTVRVPLARLLLAEGRREEARKQIQAAQAALAGVDAAFRRALVNDDSIDAERIQALVEELSGS